MKPGWYLWSVTYFSSPVRIAHFCGKLVAWFCDGGQWHWTEVDALVEGEWEWVSDL